MLRGKTVVLGVTGGIACYKAASLASALVKQHANVQVLMTENATRFISPITFEQLTGNKVLADTFDRSFQHSVAHVSVADRADFVLIAPATANVLAKLAHGLADDMLTTTVLACNCPKAAAPAMNTKMYENPVTQDNIAALRRYGWEIVEPASGRLACGAVGVGKMPEPKDIYDRIEAILACEKALDAVHYAWDNGRFVAAICAAPTILAALGITDGRKATCYPGLEDRMGSADMQPGAATVTDGRLLTGAGPGTAIDFGLLLVKALRGEDAAKNVYDGLVYRLARPQE